MSFCFHKELRDAFLHEWSDLSGVAWQDATCSISKEFRAECMEGWGVEVGGIKLWESKMYCCGYEYKL